MKKQRIIEIIILILLLTLVLTGILTFRHYKYIKPNTYNIVFKDIDSIVKGSPVRFMGINVGHVVKLKRKDKYIICKIRVTKEGVKIPDNTRAKVAFNGLGGSKSIELLPPLKDNTGIKGIVASESLRINDVVSVVRDLKDVCIIINNFIQQIDPDQMMNTFKEFTNPEIINRVNSDVDRIMDKKHEVNKDVNAMLDKGNSITEFIEWANREFTNFMKNF